MVSPLTGHFMELDLYIPEKNLAFEYQVIYFSSIIHFYSSNFLKKF